MFSKDSGQWQRHGHLLMFSRIPLQAKPFKNKNLESSKRNSSHTIHYVTVTLVRRKLLKLLLYATQVFLPPDRGNLYHLPHRIRDLLPNGANHAKSLTVILVNRTWVNVVLYVEVHVHMYVCTYVCMYMEVRGQTSVIPLLTLTLPVIF